MVKAHQINTRQEEFSGRVGNYEIYQFAVSVIIRCQKEKGIEGKGKFSY